MVVIKEQLVASREKTYDGRNTCESITIHDTANRSIGADAQAHANLQSSGNVRQASWHIQVDDTEAIRSFPNEVQCWHAGDEVGNKTSVAVEMCVNADGDFSKTVVNTVAVVAQLMKELGLTTNDLRDHSSWSGKRCPGMFYSDPGSWGRFVASVNAWGGGSSSTGGSMSSFSSPLPKGCRFTSAFGTRGGILHAGTDWGPPTPGQAGVPIHAVAGGKIIATGYGYGRASDRIPYHSGRYIWQDIGTHGGDRMRIYYGHMSKSLVKTGQRVSAGDVIGYMGGSGSSGENHFATHLHLGVSVNHSRPVGRWSARTNRGWTNPVRWLRTKGIVVGSTSPVASSVGTASSSKPAKRPSSKPSGRSKYAGRSEASVRRICIRATKGTKRNSTGHLIGLYQRQQWSPFGLVQDQDWGSMTDAHFRWVGQLQKRLNRWKGTKLVVDGDFRRKTVRRIKQWQKRNHGGAYPSWAKIDGVAGPVMCKALGLKEYPN